MEVVNLKSFSKAAEKMFLTQPTVTNHIQNLENELGTVLINRSSKKIVITDAGNILYKYALDIINLRNTAKFQLNTYKGKIQGHLDISASSIPKQYVLPHILNKFISHYPDVTFSITHNDSKKVVQRIEKGYTDFGIVGAKYESNSLEYIDLLEDNLIAIAKNCDTYNFPDYSEVDMDYALNQNLILREEGSGSRLLFERELAKRNMSLKSLNVVSYIEDNETIKKFVELGLGISFISEIAVKQEIEEKKLKPFYIKGLNLKRKFYFVYHSSRHLSPLAQRFKEFVKENVSEENFK